MSSQTSNLLELYIDAQSLWSRVYNDTNSVEAAVADSVLTLPQMADGALVLKRIKEKLEDATTEVNKAIGMIEKIACLQYAMIGRSGPIRGEICTATPRTGTAPPSLKRADNPELHDQVMEYFGFSKESAQQELARLHYPNVEKHLQELQAAGKPLPQCLKGLQPRSTFALTCRCASGVDLDEIALTLTRERETENVDRTRNDEAGSDNPF